MQNFNAEHAKLAERAMGKEELNAISERVIGAAITVHRELGPGLLEHCYKACLDYELTKQGLIVNREVPIPVIYGGVRVDCGFRLDLIVNDAVVLELKAVERIDKIHSVQLHTYLKLTDKRLGLLINFNTKLLVDGITRVVNQFPE